ncbi:MAG: [FeFe] hydrogenase H-cluster radical SAM maturase HydE [Thermotogae bacterium]|nr:[FeFe] hydrogenase H-cluster radical SAM maturase HydE [Thermotogota bacterium]HOO74169.1 [FeFe] hydrogenase H-cluster radical SAM maturase HydE [Tepiditoga sp.]
MINDIISYHLKHNTIEKKHIVSILGFKRNSPEQKKIFDYSRAVKNKNTAGYISIKAVIEFSNYCIKNCNYCGLRRDNEKVKRYRMPKEDIVRTAVETAGLGPDTIILQSGEDYSYSSDDICEIISQIRQRTKLPVSVSLGERERNEFREFKKAGAVRCLLKHESVNKKIFENSNPDKNLEKRIDLLRYMNYLGYVSGSGNIIGLPDQTYEDIADDIIFMRDENIKMIGIGPFIPAENTPFQNLKSGEINLTLNAYAATRLTIPKVQLPATTALGTIDKTAQEEAFKYACNVIMVNVTPEKYRENYVIYNNKAKMDFYDTYNNLRSLGYRVSPITENAVNNKKYGG